MVPFLHRFESRRGGKEQRKTVEERSKRSCGATEDFLKRYSIL